MVQSGMTYGRISGRIVGLDYNGRQSRHNGRGGMLNSPGAGLLTADGIIELTHTVVHTRGSLTPSFTRATAETGQKYDSAGYLDFTALSGEVVFKGAMRIRNELASGSTEDVTNAAWVKGGTAGTPAANTLTLPADNDFIKQAVIKPVGTVLQLQAKLSGTGTVTIVWNNMTGMSDVTVTLTATPTVYSGVGTATSANPNFYIIRRAGNTATSVTVTNLSANDITGETDQTTLRPYVSVGVASAPAYNGSCVPGVQYFPYDLNGNPIPRTGSYPLVGYVPWEARTQLIAATADIRDMTTASWTLGATMTRARTSVGSDGVANSATRLTGGAVAATNTILYTLVAAASSRTYSAKVKRITGTGPVRITQDGFATNTDISSQLVNGAWVVVQLNQSQLNAQMGFKIDTNTDAIDVDMNQFEAGAFATPCIQTGGLARPADILTYTGAEIANYKAMACTFSRGVGVSNVGVAASLNNNTTTTVAQIYLNNATALFFQGLIGGTQKWLQQAAAAYVPGVTSKAAFSMLVGSQLFDKDGAAQTAGTGNALPSASQVDIGHAAGSFVFNGPVTDLHFWTRNLSQSELGAVDR